MSDRNNFNGSPTNNLNFAEGIVYLTNQSADYNYTLSGQLRRRFDRALEIAAAGRHHFLIV